MEIITGVRNHVTWNATRLFFKNGNKIKNRIKFKDDDSFKGYLNQDGWKITKQNEHKLKAYRGSKYEVTEIVMILILFILSFFCFIVYKLEVI